LLGLLLTINVSTWIKVMGIMEETAHEAALTCRHVHSNIDYLVTLERLDAGVSTSEQDASQEM
jgi:hypothetical protein